MKSIQTTIFALIIGIFLGWSSQNTSILKPLSSIAKNFDNVTVGTSEDTVHQVLGNPDKVKSLKFLSADVQVDTYHSWLTGDDYIIIYVLGRVVATSEI
ncbi:MAG: hypothetical protein KGV51_08600 [Moraxellaceae bacterium]|nr:hypothetical protein [Moraxellaceae bacterium]